MQLPIILLATDRPAAQSLATALAHPGHSVTVVALPEDLLAQAAGHSLIVIDQLPSTTTAAAVITEIRNTPAVAITPILCVAQTEELEERILLLEGGADDVIAKPFDQLELEARVEALALRHERLKDRGGTTAPIGNPEGRRIVAVYSPKGGVGTTTIAANLALIAAERRPDTVAIIDLDLQFGQVSTHLNLQVRQSLLELIRDDTALREPELFRTYAARHETGLHVLAAPPGPGFANLFTTEHIDAILSRAIEAYDTVVIDAGSAFDERTLAIFTRSDTVVIPVLPEIPSLRAVRALLEQLTDIGALGGGTVFVLNNLYARELLRLRDIENVLGGKIAIDLPYDSFAYLKAANEGVPITRGAPRSQAADALRRLAVSVLGPEGPVAAPAPAERKSGGLFRRRG